jgi:hypothetical protein
MSYPGDGDDPRGTNPYPKVTVQKTLIVGIWMESDGSLRARQVPIPFTIHKSANKKKGFTSNPKKITKWALSQTNAHSDPGSVFTSPLDLSFDEPTSIIFTLIPDAWEFTNTPFVIRASSGGSTTYRANDTFYMLQNIKLARDGDAISLLNINYGEHRNDLRKYKYELIFDAKHRDNGRTFSTRIIIDPPGDNNGNPPPN